MSPLILLLVALLLLVLKHLQVRRIEREERDQKAMIALLSHRLRTPLTSVKWHTELLLNQEFGKLQIAQLELLDKVNSGISDAITVLNKFLEVSRVERGELDVKAVAIDVEDAVERVIDTVIALTQKKEQIILFSRQEAHVILIMNPLIFHTIVEGVLSNAVTYTQNGGTITVTVKEEEKNVTISITDTGIGISEKDRKRIFTKFYRSERARMMSPNGNGLGLYLIRQILAERGGAIECVSQEGKGSTFSIRMPKVKT